MRKIILAVAVTLGIVGTASAQKVTTKVIDNKGTIKWVIDSTTAVITKGDSTILYVTPKQLKDSLKANTDSAYNGITKTGHSFVLGGALTQPTTITTTATNFLAMTGLQSGSLATDSIMVVNPTTGQLKFMSPSSLFAKLTANNGLTRVGDSIQLGGNLTKPTTITTTATNTLSIPGLQSGASTDSLLVADPTTGQLKRIAQGALLQSGDQNYTATAGQTVFSVTGMPATASKVWVYRNGAKLLATTDYTATAGTLTLSSGMGSLVIAGDIIEVEWVK
jgi:hypothetical protein